MRAEDLKRWHWVVLGLLVGLALAWMNGQSDQVYPRTTSYISLMEAINEPLLAGKYPRVKDVRVHPAQSLIPAASSTPQWFSTVTFKWLRDTGQKTSDGKHVLEYQSWACAEIPTSASGAPPIVAELAGMARAHPHLRFHYLWWDQAQWRYPIYMLFLTLSVGGLWPTILNQLVGAGYGRRAEPEPKDEPWWRHKSRKSSTPAKSATPVAQFTEADLDRMRQMEQNLQGFLTPGPDPEAAEDALATPAPVRPLAAPPLQQTAEKKPEEQKEFGADGQFWPSEAHAAHKSK